MTANPQNDSLTALMHLALAGDAAAYAQLLNALALLLRHNLTRKMRQIGASDDTEDLVQDILIALHNKKHTYDISQPLLPWVRAIAHYKWVDYVRLKMRRPATIEVEDITLLADDADITAHSTITRDVAYFLEQLPPQQAELVRLAKLHGHSMSEISAQTQLSISAIKVSLHRAMHKLKAMAHRAQIKAGEE